MIFSPRFRIFSPSADYYIKSFSVKLQKHSEFPIKSRPFSPLGNFIDKKETSGKYLLDNMLSQFRSHDKKPIVYFDAISELFDDPFITDSITWNAVDLKRDFSGTDCFEFVIFSLFFLNQVALDYFVFDDEQCIIFDKPKITDNIAHSERTRALEHEPL